jgi:hypothetical protein
MKKSNIMKVFLAMADEIGEVISASIHDTWVSVRIKRADGSECCLDFNELKGADNDGN